ncbi:Fic family protein [Roseivirga sp. BDSF3-8]|uniref:Fic family protein n=1 Tax=Roseivirga sp. BDSF3-8 TaxID=3241598 RepID=UPI003531A23C
MSYIREAQVLKGELNALRPLDSAAEMRIMQKFRMDWNYHSNNLEGNSLTYGETKALLLHHITAQGKPLKDHFEITGHNEAINWVMDVVKEGRPLTENFIRELHKLLLKESYETDAITPEGQPTKKRVKVGEYKSSPNHVKTKTGEIFYFASPEETPAEMHDLINWYREEDENEEGVNAILLAAEFHYKFIRIHPFDDGNGRVARIVMNFILMKYGYPPVIIKTEDKENYFAALRQADAGMIEPFIAYIAQNLVHSLDLMIRGAKGESIEEPDDIDKEIALLKHMFEGEGKDVKLTKSKQVLEDLFEKCLIKLIESFISRQRVFDDFYVDKGASIFVEGIGTSDIDDVLSFLNNRLENHTNRVKIEYSFRHFAKQGLENGWFDAYLHIEFDDIKYSVTDGENEFVKKYYDACLSDEEIKSIVDYYMKEHKEKIAKAMKQGG